VGETTIALLLGGRHHIGHSPYSVYVNEAYRLAVPARHSANVAAEPAGGEDAAEHESQDARRRRRRRRLAYVTVLTNDAFCTGALVQRQCRYRDEQLRRS
jgi:hypothetical protein